MYSRKRVVGTQHTVGEWFAMQNKILASKAKANVLQLWIAAPKWQNHCIGGVPCAVHALCEK